MLHVHSLDFSNSRAIFNCYCKGIITGIIVKNIKFPSRSTSTVHLYSCRTFYKTSIAPPRSSMIEINVVEVQILLGDLPCASQVINSYKATTSHSRVSKNLLNFQLLYLTTTKEVQIGQRVDVKQQRN